MKEEIIHLYNEGFSHRGIAGLLGLTQYRVQRTLKNANVHRTTSEAITLWHKRDKRL